jgi:hypothetical protein
MYQREISLMAIESISIPGYMDYYFWQIIGRQSGKAPQPGATPPQKDDNLAKPNYQYEKRQRDLANKKKQEEKRQKKLEKNQIPPSTDGDRPPEEKAE